MSLEQSSSNEADDGHDDRVSSSDNAICGWPMVSRLIWSAMSTLEVEFIMNELVEKMEQCVFTEKKDSKGNLNQHCRHHAGLRVNLLGFAVCFPNTLIRVSNTYTNVFLIPCRLGSSK